MLVLACGATPALEAATGERGSGNTWVLTAGGDVDGDGGFLIDGSAALTLRERSTFTLRTGYSDASTVSDTLTATTLDLDYDQRFSHWGFTLTGGYWKDPDLVEAVDYGGSVYFAPGHGLRLSAAVSARASRFNEFTVNGVVPRPNLPPLTVSGSAGCDLGDLAHSARLSFDGERWGAYVAGKSYDYDSLQCAFTSLALGGVPVRIDRLRALNPEITRLITLRATAAGFINLRENTVFLDSSMSAGLSLLGRGHLYAVDYVRTTELLDGLVSNAFTASVTFTLSHRTDLEFHIGMFDGQGTGASGFAGALLVAHLSD